MSPLWIILTLLPILGGAARFNCKGRILGAYYADAKSGCKAFHVCVRVAGGGIRDFRFFCPPGTLFHQEAQTCTDWGDDDPLACPADIYDGYDTKKLSSANNREEETEFSLQRAETGDRRLSQNNQNSVANTQNNDLRAAHSSDFFSGQRDRGRDEPTQSPPAATLRTAPPPPPRQSFRRATTPRALPTTTQQPTTPPPPQPTYQPQYEVSKRKIIRKRPFYVSSPAPQSTFAQNNPPKQQYKEQPQQQYKEQPQPFQEPQQNFIRRPQTTQQNRQPPTTTPYVPPQYKEYKDEYVEVPRVTPKPNRYYPANPTPLPSSHATSPQYNNKKDGLIELYNYDAQSTPGLSTKQDKPYKVKNSFSVTDGPREDFARLKPNNKPNQNVDYNNNNNFYNNANKSSPTTTTDYNNAARTTTNTPSYKNFNSVSYEPEKKPYNSFAKQNNFNNPTNPTTTPIHATYRPDPPHNLNTVAYDTNNGFHSQSNFAEPSEEDDGQYRPPQGEDDGQYRPELYERELLSGAHSINIAASGNRLAEEQKSYSKTKAPVKFVSQTAAPRPFRPAPTSSPAPQTTRTPEPTYTTTVVPQTQRAFDLFQTYTTTSRPTDYIGGAPEFVPINDAPVSRTTTAAPRVETRPPRPQTAPAQAPTFPPNPAPRPTTHAPGFSKPVNKKEDNSYDYAYYDSDPGISEYDQIEEFGRTKKRANFN